MSPLAKFALLAVVFVDLIGQGLVFPIINELVMDPKLTFLPVSTPDATRHYDYGLVIGVFFLAWFLGVVYMARLSDTIGRKNAIMICLLGALVGYMITIASLFLDSLWMLIVGRAITGFTAGNQPIAQAAMIDASKSEAEKARNMGFIVAGISAGMVGGPIIGGVLSDKAILGDLASLKLPFYCALLLVLMTMILVQLTFKDIRQNREPLEFKPLEVFTVLLHVRDRPIVARLCTVYLCFMTANVTFYIFMDNYLTSRFDISLFGSSMAMMVLGIALAGSSTFLVDPVLSRFNKLTVIAAVTAIMGVSALLFVATPVWQLCYVFIFTFYSGFGVAYPTMLSLFSASVGEDEQGWVMGVTTAGFTFAAGVMSLIGGLLMAFDLRLPFYVAIVATVLVLVLMRISWNTDQVRNLTR